MIKAEFCVHAYSTLHHESGERLPFLLTLVETFLDLHMATYLRTQQFASSVKNILFLGSNVTRLSSRIRCLFTLTLIHKHFQFFSKKKFFFCQNTYCINCGFGQLLLSYLFSLEKDKNAAEVLRHNRLSFDNKFN